MRKVLLGLAFSCLACGGSSGGSAPTPEEGAAASAGTSSAPREETAQACGTDSSAVTLKTDDGVDLIADIHPSGRTGAPGIVLLHMIPPHHDKSNYSPEFIAKLVDRGWTVINVNRRGAKGSGGVAEEAYKGDKGWLDAKAGVDFLRAHPCATPAEQIVIVGASNGTTSTLDFTVKSAADAELTVPKGLVFLSGGTYTEAQHRLAEVKDAVGGLPILFAYPPEEAEWNLAIHEGANAGNYGASWQFKAYEAGGHGTKIFDSTPAAMDAVADFIDAQI
jgi:dienelactone hydrolase